MSLLGPQVAEIVIDFGKCRRLLVDLLVRSFTFRVNAEVTVHLVAHCLRYSHALWRLQWLGSCKRVVVTTAVHLLLLATVNDLDCWVQADA